MTKRSRWGSVLLYLIGIAVIAGAALGAVVMRHDKAEALAVSRQVLAEDVARGPVVQVVTVTQGPKERRISLLGDTRAYQTATLYAKVSGYVTSILVDRGDHVKAGQLLATVASVETDQQYDSAVQDMQNKKRNWERAKDLVARGWTSRQAADQAETDYTMAVATVGQMATMKSYEDIRAPFDGVVTARFVDKGALVQNSTTNKTSNQPIVTIADESRLRVDVYVEQRDVPYVHVGDLADVADGSNSARKKEARIARTSDELDPRTRTLFVELDLDNSDRFLVPGAFAYVTLHVPVQSYPEIPVGGLIVRGSRTMVADVDSDQTIHLRPVTVATTDGINASIADGLTVGQKVAINLPDEVGDGGRVQTASAR
ncbi:MAG TPA: efflux RND transporter periplasmic adaptor subunit [Rhodopila sp.]|uniref:efflux RND transporter periplasmic adaptor subunit n=1 Tax=Rhodopila sp. TaxID=2480087 RepID=UPI002D0720CD|nr:efflux RND transporter periplasmic adaptor subunit [Rhodopila sp.]HVY16245.1 efflux RND transporter periplasmic adaptor subunit [Rhodopila sp.]